MYVGLCCVVWYSFEFCLTIIPLCFCYEQLVLTFSYIHILLHALTLGGCEGQPLLCGTQRPSTQATSKALVHLSTSRRAGLGGCKQWRHLKVPLVPGQVNARVVLYVAYTKQQESDEDRASIPVPWHYC